ncbi:hypothetical protein D3C71_1649300 [compost metagenome]
MGPIPDGILLFLEEQVIQNEPQIRLTSPVIRKRDGAAFLLDVFQQRLDELKQVIDLLQFTAAVLVHLAVAGQDVQGF